MNLGIFRDYDVRALADEELTDQCVDLIARAYGTYLRGLAKRTILVGRDNRPSSPRIARAMQEGLLATGCDVIWIGETLTPLLSFAVVDANADAGAMITGSHNAAEFNGIKLLIGSRPVYGPELRQFGGLIERAKFCNGRGYLTTLDPIPRYVSQVRERIRLARPLRVVVDCGNGSAGLIAPTLIRDVGSEVVSLYCESDGRFPHHPPDPAIPANLTDLCAEVRRCGADVGLAYDGDGNRLGVVDDTGRVVAPERVLGLLASRMMDERGPITVVCDVKASQSLIDYVAARGGRVAMCRTGYPYILEALAKEGAAIAGEISGHFCLNDPLFGNGDAVFISCMFIQMLAESRSTLSSQLEDFPSYVSTAECRVPCPDDDKFDVVEVLRGMCRGRYRMLEIDGIRISFGAGAWALVRACNTEPAISLRAEARTAGELKHIVSSIAEMCRRAGIDVGEAWPENSIGAQ